MKYIFIAMAFLFGCSQDVSFGTLETARKQAKENAEYNARAWRAQTKNYSEFGISANGDSTQTPSCPQGDGWASVDLVNPANPAMKLALRCSTVSGSVGCRDAKAFKESPYANDDGRCQPVEKVPHPIPKILG